MDPQIIFLQEFFGLCKLKPQKDLPVLIAVDFENVQNWCETEAEFDPVNKRYEAGVAVLDMKEVFENCGSAAIRCHSATVGSDTHFERVNNRHLWHNTERLQDPRQMVPWLESFIPDNRRVVICGHSLKAELKILKRLNFDLEKFQGRLDSEILSQLIFVSEGPFSLRRLLNFLNIPHYRLHNAGNDAFFTLCALASLAILTIGSKFYERSVASLRSALMVEIALAQLEGRS